jgi:hypothetical protein
MSSASEDIVLLVAWIICSSLSYKMWSDNFCSVSSCSMGGLWTLIWSYLHGLLVTVLLRYFSFLYFFLTQIMLACLFSSCSHVWFVLWRGEVKSLLLVVMLAPTLLCKPTFKKDIFDCPAFFSFLTYILSSSCLLMLLTCASGSLRMHEMQRMQFGGVMVTILIKTAWGYVLWVYYMLNYCMCFYHSTPSPSSDSLFLMCSLVHLWRLYALYIGLCS